jgi:hypothetical protein
MSNGLLCQRSPTFTRLIDPVTKQPRESGQESMLCNISKEDEVSSISVVVNI